MKCHDCAFTQGTEANKSELTHIKIKLCLDTGDPFDCHVQPGRCAGFEAASQHHKELSGWKKGVSETLLQVLADVEDGTIDLKTVDIGLYIRDAVLGVKP